MFDNNLSYSPSGLKAKASFYNRKYMVYVEGVDDVIFWEQFFDPLIYKVEDVGGCGNFKEYYIRIEKGEKSFVIAKDMDYTYYSTEISSPLIVKTLGHSIESMMYCPQNINRMVQKYCRLSDLDCSNDINTYYEDFQIKTRKLLLLEIANFIFDKGVKVLDDSCFRFLDQKNLPNINEDAVNKQFNSLKVYFKDEEIAEAERRLSIDERPQRIAIKGHFLTEAIRLLIVGLIEKNLGRNVQINGDNLYADLVECSKKCVPICNELFFIQYQIKRAERELEKEQ